MGSENDEREKLREGEKASCLVTEAEGEEGEKMRRRKRRRRRGVELLPSAKSY